MMMSDSPSDYSPTNTALLPSANHILSTTTHQMFFLNTCKWARGTGSSRAAQWEDTPTSTHSQLNDRPNQPAIGSDLAPRAQICTSPRASRSPPPECAPAGGSALVSARFEPLMRNRHMGALFPSSSSLSSSQSFDDHRAVCAELTKMIR